MRVDRIYAHGPASRIYPHTIPARRRTDVVAGVNPDDAWGRGQRRRWAVPIALLGRGAWVCLGWPSDTLSTHGHTFLSKCADEKVEKEVFESCAALERETGRTPIIFAYPNGRSAGLRRAGESGIEALRHTVGTLDDRRLGRIQAPVVMAFTDADLRESTRRCLIQLWPPVACGAPWRARTLLPSCLPTTVWGNRARTRVQAWIGCVCGLREAMTEAPLALSGEAARGSSSAPSLLPAKRTAARTAALECPTRPRPRRLVSWAHTG
jgi:hypothetical protein